MNDRELLDSLKKTVKEAQEKIAEGIGLLCDACKRNLHVVEGYEDLYKFCLAELRLSKNMAWGWSRAAEAAAAMPEIVDKLFDGRLSLCVVVTLAHRLDLLAKADGMTDGEAQELLGAHKAKPRKRDVIPAPPRPVPSAPKPPVAPDEPMFVTEASQVSQAFYVEQAKAEPSFERIHVDVSDETLRKLHRAKELLRGKSVDDILGAALEKLLDAADPVRRHERREAKKQKKAAPPTPKPKKKKEGQPLRTPLPIALKDAIYVEAGGQCTYHSPSGKRCTARTCLEDDHVQPIALGGSNDRENLRLLCKQHHRLKTLETFPDWRPPH